MSVRKIDRSINFAAHNTAKWARLNKFEGKIDLGTLNAAISSDTEEWHPDPP